MARSASAICDADLTKEVSIETRVFKACDCILIKSLNWSEVGPAVAGPPVAMTSGNPIYFLPFGSGVPDLPTYKPKNAAPAPTIVDMNAACALVGSSKAINHVVDE